MATRESSARLAAPIHLVTSRLPRPGWPVVAVPVFAFAMAFSLDVATDRRFSQVWGSLALAASAGVVPTVRRAAIPAGAYVGVWVAFNAVRAVMDDVGLGLVSTRAVSVLESRLFGGELPSAVAQRTVLDPTHLGPAQLALTAVYLSFFIVPHVVAAVLLVRNRGLLWKVTCAYGLLFAAGIIAFALAPTDPPWMAASRVPSLGHVERLPRFVLGELGIAVGGATMTEQGYGFEPNPLASMPSIHLGVTVLVAAVAWQGRALQRWLACAYAAVMGIALVMTGEHYALDVIAGTLLAVTAWALAGEILGWSEISAPARAAHGRADQRRDSWTTLEHDRACGQGSERR